MSAVNCWFGMNCGMASYQIIGVWGRAGTSRDPDLFQIK